MNAVEAATRLRDMGDFAVEAGDPASLDVAALFHAAADLLDGLRLAGRELLGALDEPAVWASPNRLARARWALGLLVAPLPPAALKEGPVVPAATGPSVFAGPGPAFAARPSPAGGLPHPSLGDGNPGPAQHRDDLAARRARKRGA